MRPPGPRAEQAKRWLTAHGSPAQIPAPHHRRPPNDDRRTTSDERRATGNERVAQHATPPRSVRSDGRRPRALGSSPRGCLYIHDATHISRLLPPSTPTFLRELCTSLLLGRGGLYFLMRRARENPFVHARGCGPPRRSCTPLMCPPRTLGPLSYSLTSAQPLPK